MFASGLYGITDEKIAAASGMTLSDQAWQLCNRGVAALQLRAKSFSDEDVERAALQLRDICERFSVPLILNDRIVVAEKLQLPVHLGQEDIEGIDVAKLSVSYGISTHSVEQAIDAEKLGAVYIGVGPIFATPTKPDYEPIGLRVAEKMVASVKIPTVAIGGINDENIDEVWRTGATNVAMVRGLLESTKVQSRE